jgi:putative transcriptional regulator
MRRNWTKVELADRLSVSRQTIHAIESDRYDPSLPLALAMAKLFGHPVEAIFGNSLGDPPEDPCPDSGLSR